jgi:hypothetical protein
VSGESSSWPLRRCAHAGSSKPRPVQRCLRASYPGFGLGRTARRSGISVPRSPEGEENALSSEELPASVCSRVVFDKQKSTGGVWLAQVVPGCGWGWRTEPSCDAGTRDVAKGRRRSGPARQRAGSDQGLLVELPVGGRCSGSRNLALFTEARESDLGRPVPYSVARRRAEAGGDGAPEVQPSSDRAGKKMPGANGESAGRSGSSVVKRETHRRAEVQPSQRAGCHTSRGCSSLKCGLQKSVRSIFGCSAFGRKTGRRAV